jgi:hypothetical protein
MIPHYDDVTRINEHIAALGFTLAAAILAERLPRMLPGLVAQNPPLRSPSGEAVHCDMVWGRERLARSDSIDQVVI